MYKLKPVQNDENKGGFNGRTQEYVPKPREGCEAEFHEDQKLGIRISDTNPR